MTAVIGGAGFLAALFVGGTVYALFILLIATLGYREFCRIIRRKTLSFECVIGWLYVLALFLAIAFSETVTIVSPFSLTVVFLFVSLVGMVASGNRVSFEIVGTLLAGALYISVGFAFMALTRFLPNGLTLSLFVIVVTWTSDISAYVVGKKWGRRKLWPVISPNKTVEGSCTAVLLSGIAGALFWLVGTGPYSFGYTFVLALVVSVIGQVGDLIESALKRSWQVKDSGRLLPGHGGVLDRFDSLMFSFAVLNIFQLI